MSAPDFSNVSIAANDFRYYVKDPADVVGSTIEPIADDSDYNMLPAKAVLWDSVARYWSNFENAVIVAPYPAAFNPDPRTGAYQNLYALENQFPVAWDSTVYDASTSLEFPKGFLKPATPVVDFDADAYDPPVDVEIPDLEPPEPLVPAIVLPDVGGGGSLGEITIETDLCLATSVSYSSDSKSVVLHIDWQTPPPSSGLWAFTVQDGSCAWLPIRLCQ